MAQKEDNFKSYRLSEEIIINSIEFREIIINTECQQKHPDITDEVILELSEQLNGKEFTKGKINNSWIFFAKEPLFSQEKKAHRLVWCWSVNNPSFLGIQNCFRRRKYEKKQ